MALPREPGCEEGGEVEGLLQVRGGMGGGGGKLGVSEGADVLRVEEGAAWGETY